MSDILTTDEPVDEIIEDDLDETVEVHRDGPLSGVIGAIAAAIAVAYLLRAVGNGSLLDWGLFAVTGAVGVLHVSAFLDSRAPLMVIDPHGVRVRRGRVWQGLAWSEIERVEHRPRRSLLRDGSLTVVPGSTGTARGLSVRLSMSTRLVGADWHELADALADLSDGVTEVEEVGHDRLETPAAMVVEEVGHDRLETPAAATNPDHTQPIAVVEPGRDVVHGRRHEVVVERRELEPEPDLDETQVVVLPVAADGETVVIDHGAVPEAPADPVVGPQLAAARTRLGLSVDQLAERTRIRPHVIESIEVDDFGPCGGDFYARGHLRTLARILAVEAEPLLAAYDERYSDAPIDPRRVFEADLATSAGGSLRGTRGRLNWSVLVAAVMAVVLLWSIMRLVTEGPTQVADRVVLNGSPGGRAELASNSAETVRLSFTAATGGARVIVRDGRQQVVFDEPLAFMQTAELDVVPPVRVSTSDGGLTVLLDGKDLGALGTSGQEAQRTYVP